MGGTMDNDPDVQPPFAELMGMKITQVSRDKIVAELFVRDELENRMGVLHGGAIMAFADTLGAAGTNAASASNKPSRVHLRQGESARRRATSLPSWAICRKRSIIRW